MFLNQISSYFTQHKRKFTKTLCYKLMVRNWKKKIHQISGFINRQTLNMETSYSPCKGRTIIFSPGGIAIGKKIVCMRKMLKRGASGKKLSAETTYVMQDLGNFKKNCLHSRSGGKKLASAQSMVEKISCLPEITIPPPGGIMVCL